MHMVMNFIDGQEIFDQIAALEGGFSESHAQKIFK